MKFRKRQYKAFNHQLREFRRQFSEDVYQQCGGKVQAGPLEGFAIVDEFSWGGMADVTAKIFGYYEQQNLEVFRESRKTTLVDIGAADGFFGVGLVYADAFEKSICFERQPRSQRIIRRTARANGVLDKVEIHGEFSAESVQYLTDQFGTDPKDLFFLVDIEGGEFDLLTYDVLWAFRGCEFLIELHTGGVEFGDGKQERLMRDAQSLFDVTLISDDVRDASALNDITDIPENIRRALLSEGRDYPMQWLHLTPAAKATPHLDRLPATSRGAAPVPRDITLGTLWMGGPLGWLETMCLRSMVAEGYGTYLFSYDTIPNVPDGVTLVDAREIFDPNRIIKNRRFNSPAIHADVFRYHLIAKTGLT